MLFSSKRSMKSRQPGTVEILVNISGAAATPAASGQDAMFVESVTDNGVGSWTVKLKAKSLQNLSPKGLVALTADAILCITAVTQDSITVTAVNGAGAAKDANFALAVNFDSSVPYYF